MSEESPRWRKCYFLTIKAFKEAAAKLFVDEYFTDETEATALEMLAGIRLEFERSIEHMSWMDNFTMGNAEKKLEGMDFQVGYPHKWPEMEDFGTLDLSPNRFLSFLFGVCLR